MSIEITQVENTEVIEVMTRFDMDESTDINERTEEVQA